MYWKEKMNALQEIYSKAQFYIPNIDRKAILRKIETKFIKRPENHYCSNAFADSFTRLITFQCLPLKTKFIYHELSTFYIFPIINKL